MASHVGQGNCVECQQSMVAARKVTVLTSVSLPTVTGGTIALYKYKTQIRGIVQITEQLHNLERIICADSKIDLHDLLEGTVIEIYTAKPIKFKLQSNFSHVHGIQGDSVPAFTYAKIIIPWTFVTQKRIAG